MLRQATRCRVVVQKSRHGSTVAKPHSSSIIYDLHSLFSCRAKRTRVRAQKSGSDASSMSCRTGPRLDVACSHVPSQPPKSTNHHTSAELGQGQRTCLNAAMRSREYSVMPSVSTRNPEMAILGLCLHPTPYRSLSMLGLAEYFAS
jgi:hypothetical protein